MRKALGRMGLGVLMGCGNGNAIKPESERTPDGGGPSTDDDEAREDGGQTPNGREFDSKSGMHTSGARLKARVAVSDDGATQFLGWRDTEQNIDCAFMRASDGKLRCLPLTSGIGTLFADSQCTARMVAFVKTYIAASEELR